MSATVLDRPVLEFDVKQVVAPAPPARSSLERINRWLFPLGLAYWGLRILFQFLHAGMVASMRPEVEPASQVVAAFIESGARSDAAGAAVLMASPVAYDEVTRKEVERLFRDRPEFFRDRVSTRVLGYDVRCTGDGTLLTLEGRIGYEDRSSRDFTAALKKEGGCWKLLGIQFSTGVVSLVADNQ